MKLSSLDIVLWAAGSFLNAALVFVLLYKRRWRVVPWFTAWMSYELLYTAACFFAFQLGWKDVYRWVYWIGALGDFCLQIAVVVEIARCVLRRNSRWVEGARSEVLPFVLAGPLVAAVLALTVTPAASGRLDAIAARASLFSTILICSLFIAVVRASQRLGLDWRSHIARESFGLALWTIASFFMDTLHAYWRTMAYFGDLENARIAIFQTSLLFWCVAFWLPEPQQKVVPKSTTRHITEHLGN